MSNRQSVVRNPVWYNDDVDKNKRKDIKTGPGRKTNMSIFDKSAASETGKGVVEPKMSSVRLPKTQEIEVFNENEDYVEAALERIGPALNKICQDNHWHIDALTDRLDDKWYPTPASISRVINNDGKRRPSAGQLLELRRISGISLDQLADGNENPFIFEQMSNARLGELLTQISAEIFKRMRQE